jgi:predicted ester cyclase
VSLPPPNGTQGREALKGTIGWMRSGFDDGAYEVEDVFQSDDKVVVRCTFSGTNTREWMGHPTTGKSFLVDQIHIYRLERNRIAEHWDTTSACCTKSATSASTPKLDGSRLGRQVL